MPMQMLSANANANATANEAYMHECMPTCFHPYIHTGIANANVKEDNANDRCMNVYMHTRMHA